MSIAHRPFRLKSGVILPDRYALAPMTNVQSHPDGTLGEDELRWIVARARGGFQTIFTCAAYVDPAGQAWPGQLGVAEDLHLEGLRRYAHAVREAGATPLIQLHHGGYQALEGPDRIGPAERPGVRAATDGDLERARSRFVDAALRAAEAGFAGAELHGANGYLFTQFLAPADNPRTDRWGGDLTGRARLLRETLRAVRAALPASFAVGVRVSPVDTFARRGLTLADGAQLATWLAEDGAEWLHLSLGHAAGGAPLEAGGPPVATVIREAVPSDVAILASGGIRTAAEAEAAFAVGVDVVSVAKAGIIHPDWPRRVTEPGFVMRAPPWPLAALREAAVGEAMLAYLARFPGLIEGGAPPRS